MELKEKIALQLADLQQALERLLEAIHFEENEIKRDAVIQRFEFSFEMCWKLLQSLMLLEGKECFSPRNCIRLAAQEKILSDPEKWLSYQEARNLTSHTYNQITSIKVYQKAIEFAKDAQDLVSDLEKKLINNKV